LSHISVTRTRIKRLNPDIARKVAERICLTYRGKLTDRVRDYYGREVRVSVGIEVDGVSVGFAETDGSLNVLSDRYLWQVRGNLHIHDAIVREFVKMYTAEAIAQSLAREGYELKIQELADGIVIDAYR